MLFMSLGCGIRCASGLYRSHARIMMSSITTSGTYRIQSAQLSSCAKQGLPRSNVPFFIGRGHLEPAPNQGGLQKSSISSCTHGLSSCTSKGVPWSISYHGLSLCAHEASSCSSGGLLRFPSVVQPVFILSTRPYHGNHQKHTSRQEKTVLLYICSLGIVMLGLAYAGVPLYRMFCQASGLGGLPTQGHDDSKIADMTPIRERVLDIEFNADTASSMQWSFRPQQSKIELVPGETALAFYTAKNPTDKAIIGISTYNIVPFEAAPYFNKIQCFCFEEQRLNAHEEVDMPVFFYIDPAIEDDPRLENLKSIVLSYTFFEAKKGMHLPLPGYPRTNR